MNKKVQIKRMIAMQRWKYTFDYNQNLPMNQIDGIK